MEKLKVAAASIITVSRILFSLCLLPLSPSSGLFAAFYLLCGVSDVLDGHTARKLHTESRAGERLDSIADLCFAAVYAVKILPLLGLPGWVLVWTAGIAAVKIFGMIKRSKKERIFRIPHSAANKLTGLLLFLLPAAARLADIQYGAAIICAAATFAATEDLLS